MVSPPNGSRVTELRTNRYALISDTKFECLRETQSIVNFRTRSLNQRLETLFNKIAVIEARHSLLLTSKSANKEQINSAQSNQGWKKKHHAKVLNSKIPSGGNDRFRSRNRRLGTTIRARSGTSRAKIARFCTTGSEANLSIGKH